MLSRRRARRYALQALFQHDMEGSPVSDALEALWGGILDGDEEVEGQEELGTHQPDAQEIAFATALAQGVQDNLDEVDKRIRASSTNWKLQRMALVDRNVLRLGTYELLHLRDVPVSVTIFEAVELAKIFGSKESGAFVNGILDRIGRDVGRIEG